MTALEIYKAQYEEENSWHDNKWSKHEWVAHRVFDLVTYDASLDERFVNDILEVCKVILDGQTYEYINDEKNYVKYILVCQLLEKAHWIEWGTSIRGAWFNVDVFYDFQKKTSTILSKDILEELCWWDKDGEHCIENIPFTVDNLKALIEFLED